MSSTSLAVGATQSVVSGMEGALRDRHLAQAHVEERPEKVGDFAGGQAEFVLKRMGRSVNFGRDPVGGCP